MILFNYKNFAIYSILEFDFFSNKWYRMNGVKLAGSGQANVA